MDVIGSLLSRFRRAWWQARGLHFAGGAWLRALEIPKNHAAIYLGAGVALDRGCTLLVLDGGELHFGDQCYVNRFTIFAAAARLEVGARSMIGPFCFITDHDHDPANPHGGTLITNPTQIGADCWLGAHVSLLKGVTIGAGTIIGAGSVVTKSLPARVVAAGNPARILRGTPMSLSVAITIATRNRLAELERTCSVIAMLDPAPAELIICADGCSDGTEDFIRSQYPEAKLLVHEVAVGSIPSRNEMIRGAKSDIVVSIDDDSHPIETDAIQRIADLFAQNPKLGVASLAQRSNEFPETLAAMSFGESRPLASFVNCAAAVRRSTFLELGGYADMFEHMYEEPDFSLRCLAKGWEVRWEPSVTIRHFWTPSRRSEVRVHHRHARNEAWSVLMRCPFPYWPIVLLYRMTRQFQYAVSRGRNWVAQEPTWWLWFLRGIPRAWQQRQPITWKIYRAWLGSLRNK